jgi:hypothetical protein
MVLTTSEWILFGVCVVGFAVPFVMVLREMMSSPRGG